MLNEWLETENYNIDKYYEGFGLAIDTTDWLFIAMLGGSPFSTLCYLGN